MKQNKLSIILFLILVALSSVLFGIMIHEKHKYDELCKKLDQQHKEEIRRLESIVCKLSHQLHNQQQKLQQIDNRLQSLERLIKSNIESTKTFIRKVNPRLTEEEVDLYARVFVRCSLQYKVPLSKLLAVAYQESHFKPYAQNGRCYGMMQINLDVWPKKLGLPEWVLKDPVRNIEAGAYILRYYYDKTGSWRKALIRYYGISTFAVKTYVPSVMRKSQKLKQYVIDITL